MGDLVIVRHGTTAWDRGGEGKDKIAGHSSIPLNAAGRDEARYVGRKIGPVSHVVTSDLPRALETARLIAHGHEGASIESDRRLRALHVGNYVGRVTDDATTREIAAHARTPERSIPGGESFGKYERRITDGVGDVLRHVHDGPGHVVLVTHGSAATLIDHHLRHGGHNIVDLAEQPAIMEPGGYIRLTKGRGGWKVAESYKTTGERRVS